MLGQVIHREQRRPRPLPPQGVDPPSVGPTAIQLLRTYPVRRPRYPFARNGERSIARAYGKVLDRGRRFIYVEDQYLWSHDVAEVFAAALQRSPQLRMVAVIPAYPDQDGRASGPPNFVGREPVLQALRDAGGDRVGIYSPENLAGAPVYVHAKVCVVDDEWACVGSDNANRRSWTHDSELSAAFVDVSGTARRLRHQLSREHLGDSITEAELDDPVAWALAFRGRAHALDAWYASGGLGARPSGRIRSYTQPRTTRWTQAWASMLYRTVYDPDGRARSMRRNHEFDTASDPSGIERAHRAVSPRLGLARGRPRRQSRPVSVNRGARPTREDGSVHVCFGSWSRPSRVGARESRPLASLGSRRPGAPAKRAVIHDEDRASRPTSPGSGDPPACPPP